MTSMDKIVAWCKRHDWCGSIRIEKENIVIIDRFEGVEYSFSSFKSIRDWAGY